MLFFPGVFLFRFNHLAWLNREPDPSVGIRFDDDFFKVFLKVFIHVGVCGRVRVHVRDRNRPYPVYRRVGSLVLDSSYKPKIHEVEP